MSDLGTGKIGQLAAEFMESLSDDWEDTEGARIGEVVIISEIYHEHDDEMEIHVATASTTEVRPHQSGIVAWGQKLIDDEGVIIIAPSEEDEDDENQA